MNDKLQALLSFKDSLEGRNYFEILGVKETDDMERIRAAYFDLLKQYGADRFFMEKEPQVREAVDKVNRVLREAYETLSDASKKEAYASGLLGEKPVAEGIDLADVFANERAMTQARSLMDLGNFEAAVRKLEKYLESESGSIEAQARLSYCEYMVMATDSSGKRDVKKVQAIRETLTKASEELSHDDYIRVCLGNLEKIEGRTENAMKWFNSAVKLNPNNLDAQREIRLNKDRNKASQTKESTDRSSEESVEPQSFFERIKEFFSKKL